MLKKIIVGLAVFMMLAFTISCKPQNKTNLSLDLKFKADRLSDDLVTDIQFIWRTDPDFIPKSTKAEVFMLFWHGSNLLHQDYHVPEVPLSEWEPGKEYAYSRQIYIPKFMDTEASDFSDEETLKLSIGFYFPGRRDEESKQDIQTKALKIYPSSLETPKIVYKEGWYDIEVNPTDDLKLWRWTEKEAICLIDNPHRDALLVIKGGIDKSRLGNQKVIFKINDSVLDEFVPSEKLFNKSYDITKNMIGKERQFQLLIATDKTFVPAKVIPGSEDSRELGVKISFLYFK